jgi:hypothetical protein
MDPSPTLSHTFVIENEKGSISEEDCVSNE